MSRVADYSFRTKTGTCIITAEQIILTRQGVRGELAERVYGNSIPRALTLSTGLGAMMLALGIWSLIDRSYIFGGFFCIVGAFILRSVVISRNNSAANIIERSVIRSVDAHPPHAPFTRGYFVVHFVEAGKKRDRVIMMPGSMSGGNEEYRRAISIMRETGILA